MPASTSAAISTVVQADRIDMGRDIFSIVVKDAKKRLECYSPCLFQKSCHNHPPSYLQAQLAFLFGITWGVEDPAKMRSRALKTHRANTAPSHIPQSSKEEPSQGLIKGFF